MGWVWFIGSNVVRDRQMRGLGFLSTGGGKGCVKEERYGWRAVYRCRQKGWTEQSSTVDTFFLFVFIECIMVCVCVFFFFMEDDTSVLNGARIDLLVTASGWSQKMYSEPRRDRR